MNKYWKLISNTLIFAIGTFSSKVLVFFLMPLYTSVLSEAEYGTVDLMVQIGNFLLPLVSCGIINGIIRFGLDKYYKKKDVFTTGFVTILGGFGVLLLLEPLLSRLPYMGENTLLIYIFVLMSSMRSLCSQFVRAKGYVKLYALECHGVSKRSLVIIKHFCARHGEIHVKQALKIHGVASKYPREILEITTKLLHYITSHVARHTCFQAGDSSLFNNCGFHVEEAPTVATYNGIHKRNAKEMVEWMLLTRRRDKFNVIGRIKWHIAIAKLNRRDIHVT